MATTFSMLKIINAALLAQGQEVVAENDGSIEWMVLAENWPGIVESELESGNYHYTIEEDTSVTRTAGSFGFDDAYAVPADALYVRNVWAYDSDNAKRYEIDWRQVGSYVHVNYDEGVMIEYVTSSQASTWPANFAKGIQCMLEAVILRSLKEEWANAREMEASGLSYLQNARTKSSQSRSEQPARKRGHRSLVDARQHRG